MKRIVLVMATLFFVAGLSLAEEKKEDIKFGLGYSQFIINNNNNDVAISQAAYRIWFNDTLGADFTLGFQNSSTNGESNNTFLLGGKVLGKIVSVKSLDIYWLAGLNFGSTSVAGESSSLFRLCGGVGAEYYLLPCLSLLTELDMSYISQKDNNQFGIFASWVPQAGVRFYF
ncbi:MAG: hypothetical protein PHR82_02780 [Endomicrobiaceae bacterium]|nr:hypothetical protein [Endomicrobiaceae bacterium]